MTSFSYSSSARKYNSMLNSVYEVPRRGKKCGFHSKRLTQEELRINKITFNDCGN